VTSKIAADKLGSFALLNVAVAVQANINYLRPSVKGDSLTAEAVRISDGKTMGLYHVTVKNNEKTVAFFSGLAFKK